MAAPFLIPFNYQPFSTSVKTSSFTIPSGRYAKVVPSRADFTINGVSLSSTEQAVITVSGTGSSTYQIYVQPNTMLAQVQLSQTGTGSCTGSLTVGASVVTPAAQLSRSSAGTSTQNFNYDMGSSLYTLYVAVTGGSPSVSFTVTYLKILSGQDIWVPAGTVLAGSLFTVTEYNSIS
ncbi:MAG: hypothetical protein HUM72_12645 [Dolichospermum sp.]|nr:hypothetical protein [Dolichospermum sp.]